MELEAVSWKLKECRSELVDPLITNTDGMFIVRYGSASLNENLEWVKSPTSAVDARNKKVLCTSLAEATQRFYDWELLHKASGCDLGGKPLCG